MPLTDLLSQDDCRDLESIQQRIFTGAMNPGVWLDLSEPSEELMPFREAVMDEGIDGILCLRHMLLADRIHPVFLFEGSMLLLEIDNTSMSKATIVEAMARARPDKSSLVLFLKLAIELGRKGVDTSEFGEYYLRFIDNTPLRLRFSTISESGYVLDYLAGAVLIYGNMPGAAAEENLMGLAYDPDDKVREAAIRLLELSQRPDAILYLYEMLEDPKTGEDTRAILENVLFQRLEPIGQTTPTFLRRQILEILKTAPNAEDRQKRFSYNPSLQQDAIKSLKKEDIPLLFEARQRIIAHMTSEAVAEYYALSRVIRHLYDRFAVYGD